jgi:hypothetical protein
MKPSNDFQTSLSRIRKDCLSWISDSRNMNYSQFRKIWLTCKSERCMILVLIPYATGKKVRWAVGAGFGGYGIEKPKGSLITGKLKITSLNSHFG